jgi:hypothetical protein
MTDPTIPPSKLTDIKDFAYNIKYNSPPSGHGRIRIPIIADTSESDRNKAQNEQNRREFQIKAFGHYNANDDIIGLIKSRPYNENSQIQDNLKLKELLTEFAQNNGYFESLKETYIDLKKRKADLKKRYDFEKEQGFILEKKLHEEQIALNQALEKRENLPFPLKQVANYIFPI